MTGASSIGFIGLGKLGAPCAGVFARHHKVYGYDIAPREAPGVTVVGSLAEAVRERAFVFVAVPTPHAPGFDGSTPISQLAPRDFDYTAVQRVLDEVAPHLRSWQRLVLISTVLPGTCRRELAPRLAACGAPLIYNPYFIAMGTVEDDFLDPEFVVVGTASALEGSPDADAASELVELYRGMIGDREYLCLTWEEAEAVKVFYNTFISLKLSFVNMVQDVAQRLGHTDVDRVTRALASAGRRIISGMYMKAGMGDGGPCHPRDNIALRHLSERLDLGYDLFSAVLDCRERQAQNLAEHLTSYGRPVIIIGRSYKPGVPFVDGSYAELVAHYIRQSGEFAGFVDALTGDRTTSDKPATYLLAHDAAVPDDVDFAPDSIVVDPWRACQRIDGCRVVHYGNTRPA